SFIAPQLVAQARKARCEASGPLVIGFDPAWTGGDRHAMAWREGRCVTKVECRTGLDTMQAAGWLKQVIDADSPARVFIDVGGVGAGVYDRIREWGEPYSRIAVAVNFGAAPLEPPPLDERGQPCGGPLNPRPGRMRKAEGVRPGAPPGPRCARPAQQAGTCGPGYRYDSHTRLVLEKKADMRRRGVPSPDEWDAVTLTFAEPVKPTAFARRIEYPRLGVV